nr:hypothetical protein [Tanacetum cinerariifolium]
MISGLLAVRVSSSTTFSKFFFLVVLIASSSSKSSSTNGDVLEGEGVSSNVTLSDSLIFMRVIRNRTFANDVTSKITTKLTLPPLYALYGYLSKRTKTKQKRTKPGTEMKRARKIKAEENSSNAIAPVLPTEEPDNSLSMRDEHLSTISVMESDEVIKSSVENLVPIPSESEVTSDNESECDVPVCDNFTTFSNLLFDFDVDFSSCDDESFSVEEVPKENFKIYSNPITFPFPLQSSFQLRFDYRDSASLGHDPGSFDQSQPPPFFVIHQPPQEISTQEKEDLKQQYLDEMKRLINLEYHDEIKIDELKGNFNRMSIEINKKEKLQQLEQEANLSTYPSKHFNSFCYDDDDDEDYTVVITPEFPITDSLIMENEHLDTIPETESDEFIKSSVENLVPIPSESEDFSDIKSECDMPDCDDSQTIKFSTFSNPLFDDSTSSDDESSHEEYYLLESLLNHDTLMASSPKFDSLLEEFSGKLAHTDLIPPGINEANCDPEEDIHLVERLLYDSDFEGDNLFLEILLHDDPIPLSDILNFSNVIRVFFPSSPIRKPALPLLLVLFCCMILHVQYSRKCEDLFSPPNLYLLSFNRESYCEGLPKADHCQPPQYTVNHPTFNAHNDLLNSQNKLMEQLTSMCDMVGQYIQKKEEEKRIEEEQADNIISGLPPCAAITPISLTEEPIDSLIMEDEHLDTVLATKLEELIKSSVENLVPNPSESEGEHECDVPACDDFTTFSNLRFDVGDDFSSNSSIIPSSSKIDYLLNEFAGELTLLKSVPPRIDKADCDPEEEIRLIKRLLYDNSSPRPPEDSDSLMEEINLSFTLDDPLPSGIEEDDYDSKRDFLILEELLSNNSLSLPENESFHFDIPSSFHPPAKPLDGNTGILNIKMMGDISEQKPSSAECPMMIYGKNTPNLDVSCSKGTVNPFFDDEIISNKIDPHHFNAESDLIESLLNRNISTISYHKIDSFLEEFSGELAHINLVPPGINKADFNPEEEIRLIEELLHDNSSPRPLEESNSDIFDATIESLSPSPIPVEDSDSQMEEIDLFLDTGDLMPPGIENDDYDSEGDIYFLEELLSNNPLSLSENESSNFDHHDDPSFPRPSPEPSDVEVFFDFEPIRLF